MFGCPSEERKVDEDAVWDTILFSKSTSMPYRRSQAPDPSKHLAFPPSSPSSEHGNESRSHLEGSVRISTLPF